MYSCHIRKSAGFKHQQKIRRLPWFTCATQHVAFLYSNFPTARGHAHNLLFAWGSIIHYLADSYAIIFSYQRANICIK